MKTIKSIILAVGLIFAAARLPAQTTPFGIQNNDLGPVQSGLDSIVQLTADAQGLPAVPPDQIPFSGTFWVIMPGLGSALPFPCPPTGANLPTYALVDGSFLVDNTATTNSVSTAVLTAEAGAVMNLIAQIQSATASQSTRMMGRVAGMDDLPDDGGDDYTNNYPAYSFDTNQLWLQITNLTGGVAYLNLYNATDQVYAIWGTTNLAGGWQVEAEVWPTATNCMPFSVPTMGQQNLFLRAEDWTGVTENGNTIPDWWFWDYFETTALSDTNLDSQGNTLLSDFEDGTDPNVISFTLAVTNDYFNNSSASMQVSVQAGWPAYVAVSVDDTNFSADAEWQSYSQTNLVANLGLTEGWHQVWVGLKGRAPNATVTWQWLHLNLKLTPPQLVITGPTNGTVTVPVVQLTGYCAEALAGLSLSLSNAAGIFPGQTICLTSQTCDTNAGEFSTNYFQAYDVPLTNGLNALTLSATDWAGNVSTLTTNIICWATNPPVVNLLWPQDGMQISGSSFTIHGTVSDPTATVSVTGKDAEGNSIQLNGLTGRDGNFWIENVPLTNESESVTLSVSNAVGGTTVSFTVEESDSPLTVDAVQAGDTSVYGTFGPVSGYEIWANGVEASQDGAGNWSANITPVGAAGGMVTVTAVYTAPANFSAHADDDSDGNPDANTQATVQPAQEVFASSYYLNYKVGTLKADPGYSFYDYTIKWANGQGGTLNSFDDSIEGSTYYDVSSTIINYPATSWPEALPNGTGTSTAGGVTEPITFGPLGPFDQNYYDIYQSDGNTYLRETENMSQTLATGGPLGSTTVRLWAIGGGAVDQVTYLEIPAQQIAIGGFGNQGGNNCVYALLADNSQVQVTPQIAGNNYFSDSPGVGGQPYTLVSQCVATIPANRARTTLGVGEQVNLHFTPLINASWTTSAGGLSTTTGTSTLFTAPSNAANATVTATVAGNPVSISFKVVDPNGEVAASIIGTNHYPEGEIGAGMTNALYFLPTNVSFYRITIIELPVGIQNITGYFTNNAAEIPVPEIGNGLLNQENSVIDRVASGLFGFSSYSLPFYQGSWDYVITNMWTIEGSNITNHLSTFTETSKLIDQNADFSVTKYGLTITRSINDVSY